MTRRRIGGGASIEPNAWPTILARFGEFIPAYPGPAVIPMVKVPPPPRFVAGDTVNKARQLARSYRSVYEKRVRKHCWAFGRSHSLHDIQTSKYYLDLADCAVALDDRNIAPSAWCAFSFDAWKGFVRPSHYAGKTPPLGWVFSGVRAEERLDWFLAELPRYDGGQVWVGDMQRKLMHDWSSMRDDLIESRASMDSGDVLRIVSRYFRAGDFTRRALLAQREAEDTIRMLAERVKEGVCLW